MADNKTQFSWPAIGNDKAISFLEKSLASGKLAHSYIFIGPEDLGKSTIALAFARNLQGESEGLNSDLYLVKAAAGEKSIGIEEIREFIKRLGLSSFLNSYKIGIIKEADKLTDEAKSALLKTLEEPKDKVIIILLVSSEDALPATILSRSQLLYFQPVAAAVIYDYLLANHQTKRDLARDLANLALGRPLKALYFLEHPEEYAAYQDKARVWLKLFPLDINGRLAALDGLFKDKTYSREAMEAANNLLLLGEGLLRDLLLLSLGQTVNLAHSFLLPELEKAREALAAGPEEESAALLKRLKIIAQAKEYLSANINPRLVLEQVMINL